MELVVHIDKIVTQDPMGICGPRDNSYKRCNHYLNQLNEKIRVVFLASGFKQVSLTTSSDHAMFLFNKGKEYIKLKNTLTDTDQEPVKATVSVVADKSMITKIEALLKTLHIPARSMSLVS